jgi:hypothetical protein
MMSDDAGGIRADTTQFGGINMPAPEPQPTTSETPHKQPQREKSSVITGMLPSTLEQYIATLRVAQARIAQVERELWPEKADNPPSAEEASLDAMLSKAGHMLHVTILYARIMRNLKECGVPGYGTSIALGTRARKAIKDTHDQEVLQALVEMKPPRRNEAAIRQLRAELAARGVPTCLDPREESGHVLVVNGQQFAADAAWPERIAEQLAALCDPPAPETDEIKNEAARDYE